MDPGLEAALFYDDDEEFEQVEIEPDDDEPDDE